MNILHLVKSAKPLRGTPLRIVANLEALKEDGRHSDDKGEYTIGTAVFTTAEGQFLAISGLDAQHISQLADMHVAGRTVHFVISVEPAA